MDLDATLRILRRNYGLVLLSVVLLTGLAYGTASRQQKQYSASAVLLFRDPGYASILFNSNASSPASDPTQASATNLDLVSLHSVAAQTARALGGITAQQVESKLAIDPQGYASTVAIVATTHDPRFAARLATTYAEQFIAFRRTAARAQLISAQQVVNRQLESLPLAQRNGATGGTLRNRADELQVLAALQTGNAELVQPAPIPISPSAPKPARTAAIGLLLGLLLSAVVVLLRERLDRRLREVDEVQDLFARPVLGSIPQSSAFGAEDAKSLLPAREREAFMLLSTSLRYFDVDRGVKTVLVTSASSGDGKTTVARNLAAATALAGQRTLLIEADLRRPTLQNALKLADNPGLSDVLAGHLSWQEALVSVPVGLTDGPLPNVHFDVLPAGRIPPNPTDLVGSQRMRELLDDAAGQYRLVVVDTPPTSIVSDAIPLVSRVDGVVVVVRLSRTTREAAQHLQRQLESLGAPLLGVVVNGLTARAGYGDYQYDYPAASTTSGPSSNGTTQPASTVAGDAGIS